MHLPPTQASHQCGPGSIPGLGVKCGLSLLLVLILAPRGFSLGTPVFPCPQKPTFPNSNSSLGHTLIGVSLCCVFLAIVRCKLKVPLRRKFCIPFSLQLLKVEVINTYHAKFYIEIPTGRPVILIVKFSFVLPPLLDSKNGREPHRELDLVAPRGI